MNTLAIIIGIAILMVFVCLSYLLTIRLTGRKINGKMWRYEGYTTGSQPDSGTIKNGWQEHSGNNKTGRQPYRQGIYISPDVCDRHISSCPFGFIYSFIVRPFTRRRKSNPEKPQKLNSIGSSGMDNSIDNVSASVLQNNYKTDKKNQKTGNRQVQNGTTCLEPRLGGRLMRVPIIEPKSYTAYRFESFSSNTPTLKLNLAVNRPITFYLMNANDFHRFESKKPHGYFDKSEEAQEIEMAVQLPHGGKWFIVLINKHKMHTAEVTIKFQIYD